MIKFESKLTLFYFILFLFLEKLNLNLLGVIFYNSQVTKLYNYFYILFKQVT